MEGVGISETEVTEDQNNLDHHIRNRDGGEEIIILISGHLYATTID